MVAGGQQIMEEPKGILCGSGNVLCQDGGYLIVYICQNYLNCMLKIDPLSIKKKCIPGGNLCGRVLDLLSMLTRIAHFSQCSHTLRSMCYFRSTGNKCPSIQMVHLTVNIIFFKSRKREGNF